MSTGIEQTVRLGQLGRPVWTLDGMPHSRRCFCPLCTAPPYALAALLAFAACVPPAQELPTHQQQAVSAALIGWREAGLPKPDKGRCDFGRVYVRVEPLETGCITPVSSQRHDGCLRWESSNHFFRPLQYPVVVIDPTFPAQYWDGLIVHEVVHSLVVCSGMNPMDPGNLQHTDKRLWQRAWKDGDPGHVAAETKALALIAPP